MAIFSASPKASLHRNTRRNVRPDSTHGVLNVSPIHSRRYSFHVDDLDYDTACTVINNIVKTDLSLWMPGLSEDARRHLAYSVEVAVVIVALPNAFPAGVALPRLGHKESLSTSPPPPRLKR